MTNIERDPPDSSRLPGALPSLPAARPGGPASRPAQVRWAGVLIGVQAALTAAFGLAVLVLVAGVHAMRWEGEQFGSGLTVTETVAIAASLGAPALLGLLARKVWLGRRWARTVVVVLGWAGLAVGALGIVASVEADIPAAEIAVLIGLTQPFCIGILALLRSRPAREFVNQAQRRPAAQ